MNIYIRVPIDLFNRILRMWKPWCKVNYIIIIIYFLDRFIHFHLCILVEIDCFYRRILLCIGKSNLLRQLNHGFINIYLYSSWFFNRLNFKYPNADFTLFLYLFLLYRIPSWFLHTLMPLYIYIYIFSFKLLNLSDFTQVSPLSLSLFACSLRNTSLVSKGTQLLHSTSIHRIIMACGVIYSN